MVEGTLRMGVRVYTGTEPWDTEETASESPRRPRSGRAHSQWLSGERVADGVYFP